MNSSSEDSEPIQKDSELIKILIEFAEQHLNIQGITNGVTQGEPVPAYYFFTNQPYNENFTNTLISLALYIDNINPTHEDFNLSQMPLSLNQRKDYPITGNLIWER